MTKKNITFIAFTLLTLGSFSQDWQLAAKNSRIELGYGVFTFRELENILLYPTAKSAGLLYGKLMLAVDSKYAIGILGAYDKTTLHSATASNYFIETKSALVYLESNLVQRKYFRIYSAIGVGMQETAKELITGQTRQRSQAYELVPVGISFQLKNLSLLIEASYGCLVPVKVGLSYRL